MRRRSFLAGASAACLAATANDPGETRAREAASHHAAGEGTGTEMTNERRGAAPLDFLKEYSTTLIESAIALIAGTHEGIGLTRPGLMRRTPPGERLVGYAVTSVFSTDADDERGRRDNLDYWNYVFAAPDPKIAVSVDASRAPGSGSSWGQLNGHIHRALGCRGVVTNGGVRDIDVFGALGFHVFASRLTVGHGNPHFISFGERVPLEGAAVNSGDVICVDEHGAIVVPKNALPHVAEAIAEVRRRVATVERYCRAPGFTPAGLAEVTKQMKPAAAWKPRGAASK